jgi:hypothetical protein
MLLHLRLWHPWYFYLVYAVDMLFSFLYINFMCVCVYIYVYIYTYTPPAHLYYEHAGQRWSFHGWTSTEPPRSTSVSSSEPSMHQNRTLGEWRPLPALSRPIPAFPSPESGRLHRCPRQGLHCRGQGLSSVLDARTRDLFINPKLQI